MLLAINTDKKFTRYLNLEKILTITLHQDHDSSSWVLSVTCAGERAGSRVVEIGRSKERQTLARQLDEIVMKANRNEMASNRRDG